jgi:hypothetical protein
VIFLALLVCLMPSVTWAAAHGSLHANCPYGSGGSDGCGVSPGVFYAPAAGSVYTQPTIAQFQAYVAKSGQSWYAAHPPNVNIPAVDPGYGVGPNLQVSAMPDIAGYNGTVSGVTENYLPVDTQCVYMPATGAAWSGTITSIATVSQNSSEGILTVSATSSGTLSLGMILSTSQYGGGQVTDLPTVVMVLATPTTTIYGINGGGASGYMLTAGQYLVSYSLNHTYSGGLAIYANDGYVALNSGGTGPGAGGPPGWNNASLVGGSPGLICSGINKVYSANTFSINGWNFGPTIVGTGSPFNQASPVGVHDCVSLYIWPSIGTNYTPAISIANNAFINGSACGGKIGTSESGIIGSAVSTLKATITLDNNFLYGRNDESCCNAATQPSGLLIDFNGLESSYTQEFNYFYKSVGTQAVVNFITGNEAAQPTCSNTTGFSNPGYTATNRYNYYDNFLALIGTGHWETRTMDGTGAMCAWHDDSNVVVFNPAAAAAGESPFFGHNQASAINITPVQEWTINGNFIFGNYVHGATTPTESYAWHTDGCGPSSVANCPPTNTTASAGWANAATSIPVASCTNALPGLGIWDMSLGVTNVGELLGEVLSCTGSGPSYTLTLTAPAFAASSGSADAIVFSGFAAAYVNHMVIDTCPGSICDPKPGQLVAGSPNVGPQLCVYNCASPGVGSVFNAGCNGTGGTVCLNGEAITLQPGVVFPTTCTDYNVCATPYGPVNFSNQLTNLTLFEADHGPPTPSVTATVTGGGAGSGTSLDVNVCPTASAGEATFSGASFLAAYVSCTVGGINTGTATESWGIGSNVPISVTSGTCTGVYAGETFYDTQSGLPVSAGTVLSCSGTTLTASTTITGNADDTLSFGGVLSLQASATVTDSEVLTIGYTGVVITRATATGSGASVSISSCPTFTGTTPANFSYPWSFSSVSVWDVTQNAKIGFGTGCASGALTTDNSGALTVNTGDYISIGVPSYGQVIATGNWLDGTGQANGGGTIGQEYFGADPSQGINNTGTYNIAYKQGGAGGCAVTTSLSSNFSLLTAATEVSGTFAPKTNSGC